MQKCIFYQIPFLIPLRMLAVEGQYCVTCNRDITIAMMFVRQCKADKNMNSE